MGWPTLNGDTSSGMSQSFKHRRKPMLAELQIPDRGGHAMGIDITPSMLEAIAMEDEAESPKAPAVEAAQDVAVQVVRQAVQLVEVDDPVVPPPIVPPPAPPPAPQVCHECERLEQLVGEKDGAIRTLSEKLRADSTEFARVQRATKEECACALQLVEASKADALARAASEHERERAEQHDKMMREMAAAEDAAAAALRKAMVRDEQTKQATRQAAERAWNSVVRQPALEEHHATLEAHMRRIKQLDDEGREIAAKHERKLEEEQAWRLDGFVDEARDWRDAQMRAQGRFLHLR